MATLTSADGTKIRYRDHMGTGTPVVLIHGWPLDHTSWDTHVEALVHSGHRVVTYDRRGFGGSDHAEDGYDYKTLATDLHQLIDHLDLNQVNLVGFSMGGGEISEYLNRFSRERVRSVAFISSITPYLLRTEDNPEGGFEPAALEEFVANIEADQEAFFAEFFPMFYSANGSVQVSDQVIADSLASMRKASPLAIVECAKAWASTDFREHLSSLGRPTLVVHGDADQAVPVEVSGDRTHKAVAESTFELLNNAPHGVLASHAEQLAGILVDWVADDKA